MKRFLPILILASQAYAADAQQVLTLKQCYEMAAATNAAAGEKNTYADIFRLKDENLSKGWLPSLDANASFIYNSDVVDFAAASPSIPGMSSLFQPMPQDQYKVTLDINQVLYDGGAIENDRKLEIADLKVNEKQSEADLYKTRAQVNGYFFNILLLGRQKELLSNYLDIINSSLSAIESAIENGMAQRIDRDVFTSEKLKLEQQLTENGLRKNALMKALADITGNEIDETTHLIPPVMTDNLTHELARPELDIFDLRNDQLSASMRMVDSKRLPKAFGFATIGYGNPPGQNFFEDSFDTYYIIGAGIKWNIFDWNRSRNEKQVLSLQQQMITNRKTDLEDNLKRQPDIKMSEIKSIKELVKYDSELIELRKKITAAAGSRFENGTITATEYMSELNSEKSAVLNAEIHRISLAMAETEYLNISGKEIE